ncbi:MAG: signal peptidase I [Candidatus Aenigmarchaeota archaeon]|nr:signal peptidase I [Candidatus Aenigmarchaeota archaeon]MCK5322030.1 signal peptidase I [Candidatus Aenigmarchaeota archaeon]
MVKTILKQLFRLPFVEDIVYIVGGVLIAFILYSSLGFALHTDKPVLTVVSGSMEPTLMIGDLIVVKGVDPSDIEKGDIIVFDTDGFINKLVVHRVYEVLEAENVDELSGEKHIVYSFRTKGDNVVTNSHVDPWIIHEKNVYGVNIIRIPYLGYPRIMLNNLMEFAAFKF